MLQYRNGIAFIHRPNRQALILSTLDIRQGLVWTGSRVVNIQSNALLYVIVDRVHGDDPVTGDTVGNTETPLIDNINNNLSVEHKLTSATRQGDFKLNLSCVTQQGAMQAARLVRNAFQQRHLANLNEFICIGLVVYNQDSSHANKFMDIARGLAVKACKTPGNNIEYLDLTKL